MFVIALLRKIIAVFLSFFVLLWSGAIFGGGTRNVDCVEGYNLDFTVISDVHLEGNNGNTFKTFGKILNDVKYNLKSDTIVFLGDNTMNGQEIENLLFYGFISMIQPTDRIYTVMGNHDSGNGEGQYEVCSQRFRSYYDDFMNENVNDKPYYYREVNGYGFVFLGSEQDNVNTSFVSQEQLDWLDEILTSNDGSGLPIFVFNHHPYNYLDSYENAVKLEDILTRHKNVFYLSGHTHTTRMSFEQLDEDSYSINLPKCTEESADYVADDSGLGVQIYVFDNEVRIRARRYYDSQWGNYDFTYEVK